MQPVKGHCGTPLHFCRKVPCVRRLLTATKINETKLKFQIMLACVREPSFKIHTSTLPYNSVKANTINHYK